MIVVISGTNRPHSKTLRVSRLVESLLRGAVDDVRLLDLQGLPDGLFAPSSYAQKPDGLAPFQDAILAARGIVTVVPEYNGSFPGALKYFIDMLRFPESLVDKPAAFVGLSAGRWGAMRAVEQLEMVFQYRCANLYGRRVFLPAIDQLIDDFGQLREKAISDRLSEMVEGFVEFCDRLSDRH